MRRDKKFVFVLANYSNRKIYLSLASENSEEMALTCQLPGYDLFQA